MCIDEVRYVCVDVLPQKIFKFRVSEMPFPAFFPQDIFSTLVYL